MSQAISKQPVILQYLDRFKDQIAAALPKHLTPDRMARIVTTEVRKVPKLLQCNPKSLFGAVIQASQLGLEPGSALGHAYLIPYGKEVNLIIGYRGMIDLARRSGQIKSIEARAVHEGDTFSYSFGLKPDLNHIPSESDTKGKLTHVYAVAHLVDGGVQWDVMNRAEVEEIRAGSKAGNNGPWKTHFNEMAKKTIVRRLFKYLPVSIEVQQAVGLDEQADAGVSQHNDTVIEGDFMTMDDIPEEEEATSKTESVKNSVKKKAAKKNVDKNTGEIEEPAEDGAPVVTYAELAEKINTAENKDDVDLASDLISSIGDEKQQEELSGLAETKIKELLK